MKKWEYDTRDVDENDSMVDQLDDLGQQGWELVHIIEHSHYNELYLKREIPEPPD